MNELTDNFLAYIMFPHMEKFAVIKTAGKQFKVAEGDVIEIDRLPENEKKEVVFGDVLLFSDEKSIKVGKPTLNMQVKALVVEDSLGEKIRVFKYKAKTQYHRTVGYRSKLTKVKIEKIEVNTKK